MIVKNKIISGDKSVKAASQLPQLLILYPHPQWLQMLAVLVNRIHVPACILPCIYRCWVLRALTLT